MWLTAYSEVVTACHESPYTKQINIQSTMKFLGSHFNTAMKKHVIELFPKLVRFQVLTVASMKLTCLLGCCAM
jgi:hypothetical protein